MIASTGSSASRPNTQKNGVRPVSSRGMVRSAYCTKSKPSAQFSCVLATHVASACFVRPIMFSAMPLV